MHDIEYDLLDEDLLINEESSTAKRTRRTRQRRNSKLSSLEARRAVEELMMVKQYQTYDKLYDY